MLLTHYTGSPTCYRGEEDCLLVISYGKLGYSKAQMASNLNISKVTLDEWIRVHPEFSDAMAIALTHAQNWWESKGQNALLYDKFQSAVWSKSMTCRFRDDYGDKVETIIKNAPGEKMKIESATPEEAARKYNELLESIK